MDDKLVVVGQYENPEMAHVDHDILGDAGITAYIENENLSMAGLYHVIPHCEVRLLVSQHDAEKARQILNEIRDSGPIEEETDISESEEEQNEI
jgi:tetrahydromethanopterin S-methyltransferase subunit A